MTAGVKLTWYGDQLLKEIHSNTPEAFIDGAKLLLKAAQARAPRRSGTLSDSGYIGIEGKSTYRRKKVHNKEVKAPKGGAVVGFAAFYARFVEFGTSKRAAQPFMRPALDELKHKIGNKVVESLGRKLG